MHVCHSISEARQIADLNAQLIATVSLIKFASTKDVAILVKAPVAQIQHALYAIILQCVHAKVDIKEIHLVTVTSLSIKVTLFHVNKYLEFELDFSL